MMTSIRWLRWTVAAFVLLLIVSCGPSSDPAVEKVVKYGVSMHSDAYQALSPAQQAEALRLAKERNLPILGDAKRYYPGDIPLKSPK